MDLSRLCRDRDPHKQADRACIFDFTCNNDDRVREMSIPTSPKFALACQPRILWEAIPKSQSDNGSFLKLTANFYFRNTLILVRVLNLHDKPGQTFDILYSDYIYLRRIADSMQ